METYLLDKTRMSLSLNLKPERVKLTKRSNLLFLTGNDIGRISNLSNYSYISSHILVFLSIHKVLICHHIGRSYIHSVNPIWE